jgi:hypothetical protein
MQVGNLHLLLTAISTIPCKKKIQVVQMFASDESQPSTSSSSPCVTAAKPSSYSSVAMANTIEATGDQNIEQNFVLAENIPHITVNATETANVTVKVFTNCTVHNC